MRVEKAIKKLQQRLTRTDGRGWEFCDVGGYRFAYVQRKFDHGTFGGDVDSTIEGRDGTIFEIHIRESE